MQKEVLPSHKLQDHVYECSIQINKNIKIKRNNTEDTTKTCPCFSFLEKQGILNTG